MIKIKNTVSIKRYVTRLVYAVVLTDKNNKSVISEPKTIILPQKFTESNALRYLRNYGIIRRDETPVILEMERIPACYSMNVDEFIKLAKMTTKEKGEN